MKCRFRCKMLKLMATEMFTNWINDHQLILVFTNWMAIFRVEYFFRQMIPNFTMCKFISPLENTHSPNDRFHEVNFHQVISPRCLHPMLRYATRSFYSVLNSTFVNVKYQVQLTNIFKTPIQGFHKNLKLNFFEE